MKETFEDQWGNIDTVDVEKAAEIINIKQNFTYDEHIMNKESNELQELLLKREPLSKHLNSSIQLFENEFNDYNSAYNTLGDIIVTFTNIVEVEANISKIQGRIARVNNKSLKSKTTEEITKLVDQEEELKSELDGIVQSLIELNQEMKLIHADEEATYEFQEKELLKRVQIRSRHIDRLIILFSSLIALHRERYA